MFMGGVTAGTGCGHNQSAFQKAFAVDAFYIIGGDIVLCPFVKNGRFLTFTMAVTAKSGDIRRIGG